MDISYEFIVVIMRIDEVFPQVSPYDLSNHKLWININSLKYISFVFAVRASPFMNNSAPKTIYQTGITSINSLNNHYQHKEGEKHQDSTFNEALYEKW